MLLDLFNLHKSFWVFCLFGFFFRFLTYLFILLGGGAFLKADTSRLNSLIKSEN